MSRKSVYEAPAIPKDRGIPQEPITAKFAQVETISTEDMTTRFCTGLTRVGDSGLKRFKILPQVKREFSVEALPPTQYGMAYVLSTSKEEAEQFYLKEKGMDEKMYFTITKELPD